MANTTNNFDLPKNGYTAFDAMSLRELIINRLNEQNVFTDQNYLGSNLASIIDIISYSYHTLIYYLNKTSTESMFTEAQLYENINRIVKLIDYSPIGFQTSTLSFNCSAENLDLGLYTIPRYSYVISNNTSFSFNEDITFSKNILGNEFLQEISQEKLLYQGRYQEHPIYTATGEDNEVIILNSGNSIVDHFNIDVFVKPIITGKWEQYTKTPNLFLETGSDKKYEIRLNPNKRYEIKFGNDINGQKLQTGDQVAIYYLVSNGSLGEVGIGTLTSQSRLNLFNTPQYNQILTDIFEKNFKHLSDIEMRNLKFSNSFPSVPVKEMETPEEIRNSAPSLYRSQYRLVTTRDFETFIKTNFSNLVSDVKCVNNWSYVSEYLKYFYDIGLTDPYKDNRVLFNQVQYADSCNFNNIYLLVVPRSASKNLNYLLPVQKELINSSLSNSKLATIETVFLDPVYKAVSLGVTFTPSTLDPAIEEEDCVLEIIKRSNSRRDNNSIASEVNSIFANYFDRPNLNFGGILDLRLLTQKILEVDGVETFFTSRISDPTIRIEGLSFFIWNPVYLFNGNETFGDYVSPKGLDVHVSANNISLKFFEYPFFNNLNTLSSKIVVKSQMSPLIPLEY
jgi:hypothetical protein